MITLNNNVEIYPQQNFSQNQTGQTLQYEFSLDIFFFTRNAESLIPCMKQRRSVQEPLTQELETPCSTCVYAASTSDGLNCSQAKRILCVVFVLKFVI